MVQIWPGRFVCKEVTVCPGHIWTTFTVCPGHIWTTLYNEHEKAEASAANELSSSVITRREVVWNRRFGTSYGSHIQGPICDGGIGGNGVWCCGPCNVGGRGVRKWVWVSWFEAFRIPGRDVKQTPDRGVSCVIVGFRRRWIEFFRILRHYAS